MLNTGTGARRQGNSEREFHCSQRSKHWTNEDLHNRERQCSTQAREAIDEELPLFGWPLPQCFCQPGPVIMSSLQPSPGGNAQSLTAPNGGHWQSTVQCSGLRRQQQRLNGRQGRVKANSEVSYSSSFGSAEGTLTFHTNTKLEYVNCI